MNSKTTAPRAGRPPRLIAFGFLAAFVLSTVTRIFTGLLVRAPGSRSAPAPDAVGTIVSNEDRRPTPGDEDDEGLEETADADQLPPAVEPVGDGDDTRIAR